MYYDDKEIALNQILKNIQLLENQISEIIVSYYIPIPLKN